jgi:hypothetical protein
MMLRCWCANRGSSVLQSRPGGHFIKDGAIIAIRDERKCNATIALMQGRAHVRAALYGDDRNGHQNGHQLPLSRQLSQAGDDWLTL